MPTIEASQRDYSISAMVGAERNWPIDPAKPVKNCSTKFDKSKAKLEFGMINSVYCYTLCPKVFKL